MSSLISFRRNPYGVPSMLNLENIFDSFFTDATVNQIKCNTVPMANCSKTDDGYKISIAAPGLSRNDFNLSVDEQILTVSAKSEKEENQYREEFNYNNFKRAWALPKNTNVESITANYNAGILDISIPSNKKNNKSINIKINWLL